jgi:hypothetical protein
MQLSLSISIDFLLSALAKLQKFSPIFDIWENRFTTPIEHYQIDLRSPQSDAMTRPGDRMNGQLRAGSYCMRASSLE